MVRSRASPIRTLLVIVTLALIAVLAAFALRPDTTQASGIDTDVVQTHEVSIAVPDSGMSSVVTTDAVLAPTGKEKDISATSILVDNTANISGTETRSSPADVGSGYNGALPLWSIVVWSTGALVAAIITLLKVVSRTSNRDGPNTTLLTAMKLGLGVLGVFIKAGRDLLIGQGRVAANP